MRDPRGRRVLQALPTTAWPELEQLRERHARLQVDTADTGRTLDELRAEHAKADEQHRADYAAALARDSTGEPSRKHVEKLEAEIAATRRRFEALDGAIDLLEGELAALLTAHREAWSDDAEQALEDAGTAYAAAIDTLAAARARVSEQAALVAWVSSPELTAYRPRPAVLRTIRGPGGDPLQVEKIIAALSTDAQPPQRAREAASA